MEQMDVLDLLREKTADMSRGQRKITEFILENSEEAAFMTAQRLAERVSVSESTVVRYAFAVGFEGYPEFQESLQHTIRHRMTTLQRMSMTSEEEPSAVLRKVMRADLSNIRNTMEEVDETVFSEAVRSIHEARRVYIMGLRSSAPMAQFLGYYLNFMFDNVTVVTSGVNDVLEQLVHVTSGDVVVGISFPRYSRRTVDGMRFAKEQGAELVAITDSDRSPLAAEADYTLIARSGLTSFVDSLVAPLSLINALIVALGQCQRSKTGEEFARLEEIWKSYHVYAEKERD